MCENEYRSVFPGLAVAYYANQKGLKVQLGSDKLLGIPLETYIPSEKLAIEFTNGSEHMEVLKSHLCKQRNIKLVKLPFKTTETEAEYEGRIKMRPAVELSFLDEDSQRDVVDEIDLNDATPSHDQTIRMRKFFEEGKLTTEAIQAIMSEEKPNQREKIVLRGDRVRQLIPKNIPISQTEDFVCKALEHYNKFLRSRADRDSR